MTDAIAGAILQEVRDILPLGRVGLYEFVELAEMACPETSLDERVAHSKAALRELLEGGEAYLVWEVWARHDLQRPATDVEPADSDFAFPWPEGAAGDKPYLAVEPITAPEPEKKHFWSRGR